MDWRRRGTALRSCLVIGLILALCQTTATAEQRASAAPSGSISGDLSSLGDDEVRRRLAFIMECLDDGELFAEMWQYGFSAGYGLGIAIGAVQAGIADDAGARASAIVSAVKAVGGTTRLVLAPHPGRLGSTAILAMPGATPAQRLARLVEAEVVLAAVEERAHSRLHWLSHASNVGINLAGGGVVLAFGDLTDAAVSVGIGIVVGEVMAFSMPWRGIRDVELYRSRFVTGRATRAGGWRFVVRPGGGAIQLSF